MLVQPQWINQESVFFIQSASLLMSQENEFQNCYVSKDGGVFTLVQSVFRDFQSTFKNNAAINGGAINCNECQMYLVATNFEKNYGYTGGTIFIQKDGFLDAQLVKIKQNQAFKEGGGIYVTQSSYFNLRNCQFYQNTAYQSSAIEIFGGSIFFNSSAEMTLFQENVALNSFTVKMDQGTLILSRATFKDNNAQRRAKNIFTVFSKIYIFNSKFSDSGYTLIKLGDAINNFFGGYIFLGVNSFGVIDQTSFQNGEAYNGGAIYVSSEAQLLASSVSFTKNYAKKSGGAIYAQASLDVNVTGGSSFIDNIAYEQGDHIYFSDSLDYSVNIISTSFSTSNAQSSAVYGENLKQLVMNNVTMKDIYKQDKDTSINYQYGGGLRCQRCIIMQISDSYFANIQSANYGGVIYIKMVDTNKRSDKLLPSQPTFQITNSIFDNNEGDVGGVIYNENADFLRLISNTFINNRAIYNQKVQDGGSGGVVYYTCNFDQQQCYFDLTGQNKFIHNSADLQGGAIHWTLLEVLYDPSQTTFNNNSALIYGDDISCVPQKIVGLTQDQYETNRQKLLQAEEIWRAQGRSLTENQERVLNNQNLSSLTGEVASQKSGGTIPDSFAALVDMFGRIVGSNKGSKLWVQISDSYKQSSRKMQFPPLLEGQTTFFSQNGTFNMSGIQFTGAPGENYTLQFQTDGIDYRVPSNQDYAKKVKKQLGQDSVQFDINVDLRWCRAGESFTQQGKCQQCDEGVSFSLVAMKQPGDCISCPTEQAICLGGEKIGPNPGFWRKSNQTDVFIKCFNKNACLGFGPPEYDPTGQCLEGYQGILCTDCLWKWSKTSSTGNTFKCAPCPPVLSNALKLSGTMIVYIGVLVMMVRATLQGVHQQKSVTSIYMKIIMNHLQLIGIVQSFDFSFPDTITKSFSTVSSAGDQAGAQILSLDCFLDTRKSATDTLSLELYYQKLIVVTLLPLLVFFLVIIVWRALKTHYERQRRKKLGKEWIEKIKQNEYSIKHGDICEKTVAKVQKSQLIEQSTYKIGGKIISTLIILLFFLHPTIVTYSISDFNCVDIDGETRLKPDLNIMCWVGNHWFFTYSVALPCLIVWGLGIPFFALVMLMRHKNSLTKLETKEMFGFLYNGYRRETYYWEIVIMYRKIIIIFIAVFLQSQGVICQAMVVFAILILFFALSTKVRPFGVDTLNDLEAISVVTQIITIYCGIFFITDVSDTLKKAENMTTATKESIKASGVVLSDNMKLLLFGAIIISNLVFFVYWAIKMLQEVKGMFINKVPKLYVCLFLCNDYDKFKEQQRRVRIKEANDLLKEEYERTLKKLLALQEKGKLVLNANLVERIQMYLEEERFLTAIGYHGTSYMDPKQQKRVLREKNMLEAKNKFMQMVVPLQEGEEIDGFYKEDFQQMLALDKDFIKKGDASYNEDSLMSGVEETKDQMITLDQQLWSDRQNNMLSSSQSSSLSGDLKMGKTVRARNKPVAKWELDYKRKRRGSLYENEIDDELWGEQKFEGMTKEQRDKKIQEFKEKEKQEKKRQQYNNFLVHMDIVDQNDSDSVEGKDKQKKVERVNLQEQIEKTKNLDGIVQKKFISSKEKYKRKQKQERAKRNNLMHVRKKTTIEQKDDMQIHEDVILDDLEKFDYDDEESSCVNEEISKMNQEIQKQSSYPLNEEEKSQKTDDEGEIDQQEEDDLDWSDGETSQVDNKPQTKQSQRQDVKLEDIEE